MTTAAPSRELARPVRTTDTDASTTKQFKTMQSAFAKAAEIFLADSKVAKWMHDPELWMTERVKHRLWSKQSEIAEAVRDNKKVAVKSCHGVGKSYLAALLICWWADTHPNDQVMVISTAPSSYQVRAILWEYIRKIHRKYNLRGNVSEANEWKSETRDIIGFGRKPADTNIHSFQGIHRTYVFAVLDEACGIPESIWTGVEAITTGEENRVLAIGNPDDPATEFGRIFRDDDPGWKKFTISAFDSPNLTGEVEQFPELAGDLVSKAWVEEKRASWGVGSNRWLSKVEGEFPTTSRDNLFPTHLLQAALGRQDTDDNPIVPDSDPDNRPVLGMDVARYGTDLTTLVLNHQGVLTVIDSWEKTSLMESASKAHEWAKKLNVSQVRIDGTGVGAGAAEKLAELSENNGYQVIEMVGSAASPDPHRWLNARAFWHDHFRDLLRDHLISLPGYQGKPKGSPEQVFYEELESIKYKWKQGNVLQIESKDDMRKRGIKSPNFSDAAMYACAPVNVDSVTSQFDPGSTLFSDALETAFEDWAGEFISPY